jgi:ADP-ribosyl-[dinitrogen reductase] hydrolase
MNHDICGCLLGGAIGDAFGGISEHGRPCLSDDTQLTLATCESIMSEGKVNPAAIAKTFRSWFMAKRLSALGSSTLKALRDLQFGAHWGLAGARGEMAAGNGGAMRIAPLAFILEARADRQLIRDVVSITHHNDEAYLGALAIVLAIQNSISYKSASDWLQKIADELPDSRVRDRLLATAIRADKDSLSALGDRFGSSGYVVETVPLALIAGWQAIERGIEPVIEEIVAIGGDTDTIASIAGQLAGAQLGASLLPRTMLEQLPEREWITDVAARFSEFALT